HDPAADRARPPTEHVHATPERDSMAQRDDSTPEGDDATQEDTDTRWARPRWSHAGDLTDQRLVLVTDLGILVKKALDGTQDVFVQSIHSGTPVTGATVDVIGKNGLVLLLQPTDSAGRAPLAELGGRARCRA